jgi:hypothetical protein
MEGTMTLQRASIALILGRRAPLADPSVDQARSRSGRSLSIVIAVLAILIMVAM